MTVVPLAPGVYRIPTAPWDLVSSFAFVDDDGVTLVDCGLRAGPRHLFAALRAIDRTPEDVTTIVLTHAHNDHTGGLARVLHASGASVASHVDEADYVRRGREPQIDGGSWLGRLYNLLPLDRFRGAAVDTELTDGDVIPAAGGLRVLHTPGHTPGHISLLHQPTGVLITGDAISNLYHLRYPPPFWCSNAPLSRETADRLGELDFEIAAFTHGPEIRHGARDAVRDFLARRPR